MSYNIDTVHILSGKLSIKTSDVRKLLKKYEEVLPEDCFLSDLDDEGKVVDIRSLAWQGTGSGNSFEIFEKFVVPCLIGKAVVQFIWEGGDSTEVIRIRDGKMTQGRMVPVFDEE